MKRVFYFAYGSNMLKERLEDRVGEVITHSTYVLQGWKLVFDTGNFISFANIIPDRNSSVEGVLYELDPYQIKILDQYEGFYVRQYFDLPNNAIGYVYVGMNRKNCKTTALPQLSYINHLVDGALENKLFKTYNALVKYKLETMRVKKCKHKYING